MSGEALGTGGVARRSLLRRYPIAAIVVGAVSAINAITDYHGEPRYGLAAPILWKGSSGLRPSVLVDPRLNSPAHARRC
ncbi:MAG: hypothetical protein JO339_38805 [Alphaproteobacteria bacterium]|nr:hypothetical protein [Alphaproteobacteria bacterium]